MGTPLLRMTTFAQHAIISRHSLIFKDLFMSAKVIVLTFIYTLWISPLFAASLNEPVHLDRQKVATGCATCHYRFNFKSGGGSDICIVCHGEPARRLEQNRSLPKGFAHSAGTTLRNIDVEFQKTYRHPTFDTRAVHRSNEALPERDPRVSRHADCVDCHNPHLLSATNKFAGINGKKVGNLVTEVTHEYELCYRCHSESANLPGRYSNKRAEF